MKDFSSWPDVWLLAHTYLEEWFGSILKPTKATKASYFLLILGKTAKLIQIFLPDTFEPYFQVKDFLTSKIFFRIQTWSISISMSGFGFGLLGGSKNADLSIPFSMFWKGFGGSHLWNLTLLHVESPNFTQLNWLRMKKKGHLKLEIIIFYNRKGAFEGKIISNANCKMGNDSPL